MKRAAMVILTILLMSSTVYLIACTSTESVENNFSVGSNPQIHVDVGNGDIDIIVGEEGIINTSATLQKPDKIEYDVTQDGDTITVSATTKSNSRADVTVSVPENCAFILSTGNGRVEVVDLHASGELHSGNGKVALVGVQGNIEVSLGNGDISLEDVKGSFDVYGGNGNIVLSGASGSFDLYNGNGKIVFQGELIPGSENTFSIGNGPVTVELLGSPSVALDLETEDGEVKSDLPVTVQEKTKHRLVGTIGEGEASLSVHTGNGDITIK